jgi:hypothetical protein
MTQTTITIGWTKADRANDYIPFSDGYRPGADQHTETITVPVSASLLGVADAVYEATNNDGRLFRGSMAWHIQEELRATGYRGEEASHYSLSVGDTVTVNGSRAICERSGWRVEAVLDQDAQLRANYRASLKNMELVDLLDALQAGTRQAATWGTFTDEASNGREMADMAREEIAERFAAVSFEAATLRQVADLVKGVLNSE